MTSRSLTRLFYGIGAFMAISTGFHWLFIFRNEAHFALTRPAIQLHGFQMLYCTLAYFIFGAIMSEVPQAFHTKPFSRTLAWVCLSGLLASEFLLFVALRAAFLFDVLIGVEALTYGSLFLALVRRLLRSQRPRAFCLLTAVVAAGTVGAILGALALKKSLPLLHSRSVDIGLFAYAFGLITAYLCWRHAPQRSTRWILTGALACGVLRGFGVGPLLWLDAALALLLGAYLWKSRTLKMSWIRLALLWALLFFSLSLVSPLNDFLIFHQRDWLHLFTLGCLSTLLMTGLARYSERGLWPAVSLMQAAALVRIVLSLNADWRPYRYTAAAFWIAAFGIWFAGFVPSLFSSEKA